MVTVQELRRIAMPTSQQIFVSPLKSYLETIEHDRWHMQRIYEPESSRLCLSSSPIAVMNVWETLIEATKNKNFLKFMLSMGKTEDDIRGEITGWQIYRHERPFLVTSQARLDGTSEELERIERLVYMPETKFMNDWGRQEETLGPLNPYRSFKTSKSSVARTMRNIESQDLEFVYSFSFTYPKEVSSLFVESAYPQRVSDRMKKCENKLADYLGRLMGGKIAMALNRHVWSSKTPNHPHAHDHVLLLDRIIKPDGTDGQIIPSYFMEWNARTRKFDQSLVTQIIKRNWAKIVNDEFGTNYDNLDVDMSFVELKKRDGSENVAGHRKLINKMKYNRRRPIADLALFYLFNDYKSEDVDDEFASYLIEYDNRTRVFGYWNRMSKYARKPVEQITEKEALCPVCNQKLVYVAFHSGKELPDGVRRVFVDRIGKFWELVKGGG